MLTALVSALMLVCVPNQSAANPQPDNSVEGHNQIPRPLHKATSTPRRLTRTTIQEKLTFSVGSYFSHGDYRSDQPTDVISVPFRVSYQRDAWSIHAQLPYLHMSGPENVLVIREGGEMLLEHSKKDIKRQGFGDLRLSSQYLMPWPSNKHTRWYLGGGIKLPTADEDENLGTGEYDFHLYTGGYYRTGRWIIDSKIGHQWMGDPPNTDYNNRTFFSLGNRYLINRSQSIGLAYRYKEASSDRSSDVQSLTTSFHQKLNYGWKVSFSAGMGFGDSSADVYGGIQISKSLIRKKRR